MCCADGLSTRPPRANATGEATSTASDEECRETWRAWAGPFARRVPLPVPGAAPLAPPASVAAALVAPALAWPGEGEFLGRARDAGLPGASPVRLRARGAASDGVSDPSGATHAPTMI